MFGSSWRTSATRCAPLVLTLLVASAAPRVARGEDQARSAGLSPAPISQLFFEKGRGTVSVEGAAGSLSGGEHQDNITVVGLGAVGTYALSDRLFLTGSLQAAAGSQSDVTVSVATLVAGVGWRFLGEEHGTFALAGIAGIAGVSTSFPDTNGTEWTLTGEGIVLALQAEWFVIPYLSIVPHASVFNLLSVQVEQAGQQVADVSVNETYTVSGFDLWLYLNPESRRSHIALGVLGNFLQQQSGFVVNLGYAFSFGGDDAASTPAETSPSPPQP